MKVTKSEHEINIRMSEAEESLVEQATETLIEKYRSAGGDPRSMMSREAIGWFFTGLLGREGEAGVREFLDSWTYHPSRKQHRAYA